MVGFAKKPFAPNEIADRAERSKSGKYTRYPGLTNCCAKNCTCHQREAENPSKDQTEYVRYPIPTEVLIFPLMAMSLFFFRHRKYAIGGPLYHSFILAEMFGVRQRSTKRSVCGNFLDRNANISPRQIFLIRFYKRPKGFSHPLFELFGRDNRHFALQILDRRGIPGGTPASFIGFLCQTDSPPNKCPVRLCTNRRLLIPNIPTGSTTNPKIPNHKD
jgi:hypothetical protein